MPARVRLRWAPGARGGAPVDVVGFHRAVLGVGEGARLFRSALEQAGIAAFPTDVSELFWLPTDLTLPSETRTEAPRTVVTHLNPPELVHWLERTGGRSLVGARHVGYWAWELPHPPEVWRAAFDFVDEVWTPSTFSRASLLRIAPPNTSISVMPHPMFAASDGRPDRERFGIPENHVSALCVFDARSSFTRKNAAGTISVWVEASRRAGRPATLICKVNGLERAAPSALAELERASSYSSIRLLLEPLSDHAMSSLIASTDIFLSLHRAEGFGLGPASAMRAGRAVVATGWSGNMDYMDAETAALVPYTLVPVADADGIYQASQWAEPDAEVAIELVARLIADDDERARLGARAAAATGPCWDARAWASLAEELVTRS